GEVMTNSIQTRPSVSRLRGLVLAGLVAVLWAGVSGTAHAQGGLAVEVTPLRVELKMAAKATHTQVISLRNDGKETMVVRARIDEYWLSEDGTPQFKYAAADTPFSASGWVRLNPSTVTIAPGQTASVRATTTVPAEAQEGAYRCAVMFEFDPPGLDLKSARKDMQFRGRVATIVYATVGAPKTAIDLVDLQVQPATSGAHDVIATLTNTGRGYARTKGTLVISAAGGVVVRQLTLPGVPVLPDSRRQFRVSTAGPGQSPLEPGQYTVEVRIDVGQAALIVGETSFEVPRVR
ncbi:MAG: hypothetical protein Q7V01_10755, partial [Vicinamibacterales bacterium]|nr:hypothetical protein [Vicinamibacterales bacterium]